MGSEAKQVLVSSYKFRRRKQVAEEILLLQDLPDALGDMINLEMGASPRSNRLLNGELIEIEELQLEEVSTMAVINQLASVKQ
jgi:hypothetical protein